MRLSDSIAQDEKSYIEVSETREFKAESHIMEISLNLGEIASKWAEVGAEGGVKYKSWEDCLVDGQLNLLD